ncbi:GNAT family N-acetyltransferase [Roseibium marinum]|uniref:Ribosomal protein S18 acetylase RimI-like enzyme n=1 Tax=Roseibium marinum TaxID=281252 RepID=A0A2S3UPG4_9HYPH|nr:GNAT family N-acetyltransferase [Roseibium marinum]POF29617.1 ribosomal protein S18 acetylase RimI-like enzyme [Roseibium marinum]
MNLRRQTGALPLPPRRHAGEHRIAYRSMREDDLPFLAALYRSTRETELARTSWPEPEKQAFIAMQFEAQHRHYQTHYPAALWLIVEQEGTAVGRLYLERWTSEHRIIDVALIPEARGRGIGGAILRDLMEEAANAGKAVSIHVEKENPAMSLYSRLGFVKREDKGVYDLLDWRSDRKVPTGCT